MEILPQEMQARLDFCQLRASFLVQTYSHGIRQASVQEFHDSLKILNESYRFFKTKDYSLKFVNIYKLKLRGTLEQESVLNTLLSTLSESLNGKIDRSLAVSILTVLATFSSLSNPIKKAIVNYERLVPLAIKTVETVFKGDTSQMFETDERDGFVSAVFDVIANVSIVEQSITTLRRFTHVISKFLNSPNVIIKLKAVEIIARVATKPGVETPETNLDTLKTFINILTKAHRSVDRWHNGWSVWRVCNVLRHLSCSNANQTEILEAGCLPHFAEILFSGLENEIKEVLFCLCNLSLQPKNQSCIWSESIVALFVRFLYHSDSDSTRQNLCHDILRNLSEFNARQGDLDIFEDAVLAHQENKFNDATCKINLVKKMFRHGSDILQGKHISQELGGDGDLPFRHMFVYCVSVIDRSYWLCSTDKTPVDALEQFRSSLGDELVQSGVLESFIDFLCGCFRRGDLFDKSGNARRSYWRPVYDCLSILVNYSGSSLKLRDSVAKHKGLLPLLFRELESTHTVLAVQPYQTSTLHNMLKIVHNTSLSDHFVNQLRSLNVIKVVTKYLKSPYLDLRLKAVEILHRVSSDLEIDSPEIDSDMIASCVNLLTKATDRVDRCHSGWSSWRLCQLLRFLSCSRANTIVMVDEGCMIPLVELLLDGSDLERKESLLCIRNLTREPRNHQNMLSEPANVLVISFLYDAEGDIMRRSLCREILTNLRELIVSQGILEESDEVLEVPTSCSDKEQTGNKDNKRTCLGSPKLQITKKLSVVLKLFKKSCDLLPSIKNSCGHGSFIFKCCVMVMHISYDIFKAENTPTDVYSCFLLQNGAMGAFLDIVSEYIKTADLCEDTGNTRRQYWWTMRHSLGILGNFSAFSNSVRNAIALHGELLPSLVRGLEIARINDTGQYLQYQTDVIERVLAVVHNISHSDDLVPKLRNLNIVEVIQRYLSSPTLLWRLLSIGTLARVYNETEARDLLGTHTHLFSSIIDILKRAIEREDHVYKGWHVKEMISTLQILARCDVNKAKLVEGGCLPILTNIFQKGWPGEQQRAIQCLRHLSFENKNKLPIILEPGLFLALNDMHKDKNHEDTNPCNRISPELRDVFNRCKNIINKSEDEKCANIGTSGDLESSVNVQEIHEKSSENTPTRKGYVMLSYETKDKDIVEKIHSRLTERGTLVWMGDDNDGFTLEEKARAVENSAAVVIAMSQRYKNSPNCREVTEYARKKGKPIIPLRIQPNYEPDGWLGLLTSSKRVTDVREENLDVIVEWLDDGLSVRRINYLPNDVSQHENTIDNTPSNAVLDPRRALERTVQMGPQNPSPDESATALPMPYLEPYQSKVLAKPGSDLQQHRGRNVTINNITITKNYIDAKVEHADMVGTGGTTFTNGSSDDEHRLNVKKKGFEDDTFLSDN